MILEMKGIGMRLYFHRSTTDLIFKIKKQKYKLRCSPFRFNIEK